MKKRLELESLERLGWRFGLQTIRALLAELGDPHHDLRVAHVAGSNGKGSTCAFLASFLRFSGYRTGLYTSPHLCDIRERFRINGRWISLAEFHRYSRRILAACAKVRRKLGHLPTHFEALTALAFLWFKEQKVDWVVLETGLGGRLDATNVIPNPELCLITPVSLEHQDILGKTIEKISWEKAGILKKGCPAAAIQTSPKASRTIDKEARKKAAPLWLAGRDFTFRKKAGGFHWRGPGFDRRIRLGPLPPFQIPNAALALAGIQMLRAFGVKADARAIEESFLRMRWPGRLEIIRTRPPLVIDGAHNPAAARALFDSLKSLYPNKKWIVLNGFLKDKDYPAFARILKPLTFFSVASEPDSNRAETGQKVVQAWEKAGVRSFWIRDWKKALALSRNLSLRAHLPLLVTGSLYLVGANRRFLIGTKGIDQI